MTTDLLKLSAVITGDTRDKLVEKAIREHAAEIRDALKNGKDYELPTERGTIVIRAKKAA